MQEAIALPSAAQIPAGYQVDGRIGRLLLSWLDPRSLACPVDLHAKKTLNRVRTIGLSPMQWCDGHGGLTTAP